MVTDVEIQLAEMPDLIRMHNETIETYEDIRVLNRWGRRTCYCRELMQKPLIPQTRYRIVAELLWFQTGHASENAMLQFFDAQTWRWKRVETLNTNGIPQLDAKMNERLLQHLNLFPAIRTLLKIDQAIFQRIHNTKRTK